MLKTIIFCLFSFIPILHAESKNPPKIVLKGIDPPCLKHAKSYTEGRYTTYGTSRHTVFGVYNNHTYYASIVQNRYSVSSRIYGKKASIYGGPRKGEWIHTYDIINSEK